MVPEGLVGQAAVLVVLETRVVRVVLWASPVQERVLAVALVLRAALAVVREEAPVAASAVPVAARVGRAEARVGQTVAVPVVVLVGHRNAVRAVVVVATPRIYSRSICRRTRRRTRLFPRVKS